MEVLKWAGIIAVSLIPYAIVAWEDHQRRKRQGVKHG